MVQHFVARRRSFNLLDWMDFMDFMRWSKWHARQRANGNYLSVCGYDQSREVCGHSLVGIAGSISACGISGSCECCLLSGRVFWDGPIPRPGGSYRVCVCVFVSLSVIRCNNYPLYPQWAGRRGQDKKESVWLTNKDGCWCTDAAQRLRCLKSQCATANIHVGWTKPCH